MDFDIFLRVLKLTGFPVRVIPSSLVTNIGPA